MEKTLAAVGIRLRDTTDSFRPLEDVIADVARQWDTLSEVQRAQISNAIAGQRQAQIFAVTMQNFDKIMLKTGEDGEYMAAQLDSQGLAAERYSIYLKSVEAAQNKMTASWERLWQTSVDSGMITWWLNFASNVLDATTAMGGLNTILKLVIINLVAFNARNIINGMTMFIASVQQGIGALRTLGTTATITGAQVNAAFGVIGLVVSAGLLIWNAYSSSVENTAEKISRLTQEISDLESELNKTKKGVTDIAELGKRYEELRDKSSLSTAEQQEFYDVQQKIRDILPTVSGHFDEQGNFIIDETVAVRDLTQAMRDLRDAQLEEMQAKAQERILAETDAYKKQVGQLDDLIRVRNTQKAMEEKGYNLAGIVRSTGALVSDSDIAEQKRKIQDTIVTIKRDFYSLSEEQQAVQLETLRGISSWGEQVAEELTKVKEATTRGGLSPDERDEMSKLPQPNFITDEDTQNKYLGFLETVNKLTEDRASLLDVMSKAETGSLQLEDLQALAEAYPNYLDALREENGQLILNTDMVREYMIAKADAAVKAAELNGATQEEINILRMYADELRGQATVLVGNMEVATGAFNQLAWQIAQDANMSGNSFVDMQGKALTSADAIYQFMTSGDAAFNEFVRQAAAVTGRTVQEIMASIGGMIAATYTQTMQLNAALAGMGGLAYGQRMSDPIAPIFTPAPIGYQYAGGLDDYNKSIGGGGGSSKKTKEEEKQRKIDKEISEARKKAIDDLQAQLKTYKGIIDARKELLETMKRERDYQEEVKNRSKSILKLQTKLAALQFDDSEEAQAQRLRLKEELAQEREELKKVRREHSIEVQKAALDKQYAQFEKRIETMISSIEGINATSLEEFTKRLAEILSKGSKKKKGADVQAFHSGADAGFVGGQSAMASNEHFAKLLKGEMVVNPRQMDSFMRNTLPDIIKSGSGDIQISMPINVEGNLDKETLPELERIVERTFSRLNKSLMSRGYTRRAESFGT